MKSDTNCSVDLRSTTAVGDRRLEFLHFRWGLSSIGRRRRTVLNSSPSPPWGRGWLATGASFSRGETGEGVQTVGSHLPFPSCLHAPTHPLTHRLAVPPLPQGGEGKCRNSRRRSETAATTGCANTYVAVYNFITSRTVLSCPWALPLMPNLRSM